jgi:phosphoribosylformylglycinamidine synthase I
MRVVQNVCGGGPVKPKALVPWMPGTNCHLEMARAFELAGAIAEIVPLRRFLAQRRKFSDHQLIGWAGGFSWGDHLRAGWIAAIDLTNPLRDQVLEAREKKVPMLGVCNGCQILVSAGLLPGLSELGHPTAALDTNSSGRFEHRNAVSIYIQEQSKVKCLWTEQLGGQTICLPVANGEGRFVWLEKTVCRVVATYGSPRGEISYPASPSGSPVAGMINDDGTILVLMPHPERRIDMDHGGVQGLGIFQAGVAAVL